jgi:CheY-like chemotaxis protein
MKAGRTGTLVLLVEDDEAVRRVAAASLARLGYRVIQAPDGRSALEVLESGLHAIDLVFSDVRMPGLSGADLARIVADRWPQIPVLLTSGHARSADFADLVCQVLPKPYSRARLASAVADALGVCAARED